MLPNSKLLTFLSQRCLVVIKYDIGFKVFISADNMKLSKRRKVFLSAKYAPHNCKFEQFWSDLIDILYTQNQGILLFRTRLSLLLIGTYRLGGQNSAELAACQKENNTATQTHLIPVLKPMTPDFWEPGSSVKFRIKIVKF